MTAKRFIFSTIICALFTTVATAQPTSDFKVHQITHNIAYGNAGLTPFNFNYEVRITPRYSWQFTFKRFKFDDANLSTGTTTITQQISSSGDFFSGSLDFLLGPSPYGDIHLSYGHRGVAWGFGPRFFVPLVDDILHWHISPELQYYTYESNVYALSRSHSTNLSGPSEVTTTTNIRHNIRNTGFVMGLNTGLQCHVSNRFVFEAGLGTTFNGRTKTDKHDRSRKQVPQAVANQSNRPYGMDVLNLHLKMGYRF
jgi:hypothetical protein